MGWSGRVLARSWGGDSLVTWIGPTPGSPPLLSPTDAYRALDETSSFWIPVTAVTVLEPCTGNVLRKYLIRILAIAVALGMGTLVLLVAFDACDTSPMDLPSNQALFAHMVCLGTTICA